MNIGNDARTALINTGRDIVRAYKDEVSRRHMLEVLISACIAEGVNTRNDLIKTVPRISEYRHAHVAHTIDALTGNNPQRHCWFKDTDGFYELLKGDPAGSGDLS